MSPGATATLSNLDDQINCRLQLAIFCIIDISHVRISQELLTCHCRACYCMHDRSDLLQPFSRWSTTTLFRLVQFWHLQWHELKRARCASPISLSSQTSRFWASGASMMRPSAFLRTFNHTAENGGWLALWVFSLIKLMSPRQYLMKNPLWSFGSNKCRIADCYSLITTWARSSWRTCFFSIFLERPILSFLRSCTYNCEQIFERDLRRWSNACNWSYESTWIIIAYVENGMIAIKSLDVRSSCSLCKYLGE
jgi:hypothetical protein